MYHRNLFVNRKAMYLTEFTEKSLERKKNFNSRKIAKKKKEERKKEY